MTPNPLDYRPVPCPKCGRWRLQQNGICEKCRWDADGGNWESITRPVPDEDDNNPFKKIGDGTVRMSNEPKDLSNSSPAHSPDGPSPRRGSDEPSTSNSEPAHWTFSAHDYLKWSKRMDIQQRPTAAAMFEEAAALRSEVARLTVAQQWIATNNPRTGDDEACFYCRAEEGSPHLSDCLYRVMGGQ